MEPIFPQLHCFDTPSPITKSLHAHPGSKNRMDHYKTPAVGGAPSRIGILDLPEEIQKEICSHCSQCDLICLSLVSSSFRELAAAQLYRNFHIVFPDEDDPCFDSPIDGLAGGLDTFVTSDYNYAKHLRDISLDTLSAGSKAELAYKPYLANLSCGKFMNTLLLLTLRKAKALEFFKWNIRVELSRPVYKALHDIKSIRSLHLRLQAGVSLYEAPPPLPYSPAQLPVSVALPVSHPPDLPSTSSLDVGSLFGTPSLPFNTWPPPPPSHPASHKLAPKGKQPKKSPPVRAPPTISGFKDLETLAILDIDTLSVVKEIKTCVRNSSSTLRNLKLSFSDALAMKARKPTRDVETIDPSDSEAEDDFQVVPLPGTVNYDGGGTAKAFKVQQERKCQESVLGLILDVDPAHTINREPPLQDKSQTLKEEKNTKEPSTASKEGQAFIDAVTQVFQRLQADVTGTSTKHLDFEDKLDMLGDVFMAARKYVDAKESPGSGSDVGKAAAPGASSSSDGQKTSTASADMEGPSVDDSLSAPNTKKIQGSETGLFKQMGKANEADEGANPDDIDIAVPDELSECETTTEVEDSTDEPTPVNTPKGQPLQAGLVDVEARIQEARDQLNATKRDMEDIEHEMNIIETEREDNDSKKISDENDREIARRRVSEYTRSTRGIALESLSIHLIPIKASVLARAIDLYSLQRITLLNVGYQSSFWHLLRKENRLRPLPLRKIFTDHAQLAFLHLVSELESVDEVFMLERSAKYKPESLASKADVTLEQIRKFILKPHIHALKRLMIKNEADSSWDVDERTVKLICRRGRVLEELAASMGIAAIHTFIQHISGLVSLRALQLVSFRNDDTCHSVIRETRNFLVDTLSYLPGMKLEWLSMGDEDRDRTVRIIRKTEDSAKKTSKKNKGKGKPVVPIPQFTSLSSNGPYPVFAAAEDWPEANESSDDSDTDPSSPAVKLELVEGIAYYDVWGVKIFEKEIIHGRL
ncbi:hypothetical protein F4778DRAFT_728819 [Xylariomycetidae sp. FL2044]|nr:hypothetical protein F4778DRAFT_728819 [Xylariomycetidae sp. FL2044]